MKTTSVLAVLGCILILAACLTTGCTDSTQHPAAEPAPSRPAAVAVESVPFVPPPTGSSAALGSGATVRTIFVNSTSNGKIVIIPTGERVLVRLNENSTSGYTWSTTISKGLSVIFDNYFPPDSSPAGLDGYHEWILRPQAVDTYTFRAVSLRSGYTAEPPGETFSLVIQATRT